ncbi:hypothetical protein HNP55_001577 [Paucibacter oligotrophus]|uniref:YdhG-like domain-containing protein n=1 Tax=Roseateles oligotrophus TaxID=1769250 RepID=A0A840LA42_9BURK|nr:DUF1801 domain-containing protein [Roseateles oligotrophus]MBB4843058.1 hypothetical protein [Roseateles oligotrophus]
MAKSADLKTQPSQASVQAYLDAIEDAGRRADCEALIALMQGLSQAPATLWGPSIVGFGRYHYRYDSGHEGEACLVGFSSRKAEIALYLAAEFEARAELLARLGKHKTGKACLYIKRLADVELPVLEALVQASIAATRRRYPDT